MSYHVPVLLKDSVDALVQDENGVYVDATYGGGGHSKLVLDGLSPSGKLYGFDQDSDALENEVSDDRLTFVQGNFRYMKRFLRLYGETQVDGILADLGVSSHQFNVADRGFSFRFDEAALDMRMDKSTGKTAADILNTYSEEELLIMFSNYGELRNSRSLAKAILAERIVKPINEVQHFLQVLGPLVRGKRNRYLSQVFQALRIEVNDEMGALQEFLEAALEVLKPGGHLVVISYHSLEDRLVKRFMKHGTFEREQIKDFYGNIYRPFKLITRKAVEPTVTETELNPRARSAKLRVAQKI